MTTRGHYYNEFDPKAADFLEDLIFHGQIPEGYVDRRSIVEVQAEEIAGYTQCHFFAGIGGWPYALRLAGYPEDRPVWTGSCPCQPFSVAGRREGINDPRHLWPHFFRLIRACRPPVVFGEQVGGKAGYGWFDGVAADLEGEDYTCRAFDIPACAVDAPHRRQRLYWCGVALGDTSSEGLEGRTVESGNDAVEQPTAERADGGSYLGNPPRVRRREGRPEHEFRGRGTTITSPNGTCWADYEWITCHDGKARRTKPGIPLLAHGVPNRVAQWRGFGNAIVPPLAAEVIRAFLETEDVI